MAVYDREQQRIVLRIVYDGPARAGKTTNVKQLAEFFTHRRRSDVVVPEELRGRTLYFDWMQLDGGLVAGENLRCQFVTVPGQRRLAARRKHILETADVVVFVCSSAERSLASARATFETLKWALRGVGREHVPVVVQANKQDLKTAVSLGNVRAAMNLAEEVPLVGATANTGGGVRETAVLAIRAAAKTAETLLFERGLDALLGRSQTAEELLAGIREHVKDGATHADLEHELLESEEDDEEAPETPPFELVVEVPTAPPPQAAAGENEVSESTPGAEMTASCATPAQDETVTGATVAAASSPVPPRRDTIPTLVAPPATAGVVAVAEAGSHEGTGSPPPSLAAADDAPCVEPGPAENEVATAEAPKLPSAPPQARALLIERPPLPTDDIPTGCVWPSTAGRQILRSLAGTVWTPHPELSGQPGTSDGSGAADVLIYSGDTWCAKTSARRRYATPDEGRAELLNLARRKILLGELLVPNTVVALQQEGSGTTWMWTFTPWLTTLRAEMLRSTNGADEPSLASALCKFADAAVAALVLAARRGVVLDVHPSNFGVRDGTVFYIDDDIASGSTIAAIGHALLQRVEEYADHPTATNAYVTSLCASLAATLLPSDARSLQLAESIESAIARHPRAVAARDTLLDATRTLARRRDP